MKKIYGGKLIQPIMAAAVFMILSVMYFLPQLQGKVLQPSDTLSGQAMMQEAIQWQQKTGRTMLWTNSMFGGMPTYQMSAPQKNNLTGWIHKAHQFFIERPIGYFFAAMLGCYLALLCLGAGHWPSMLGAVAFGLTTNQLSLYETGHMSKFMTIVYSTYIIAGTILTYQRKYLLGAILFLLGIGLSLFNNHVQMTYYLGIIMILYVIMMFIIAIKRKELPEFLKASAILVAGVLIGLGSYASKLWTTIEFSADTMRGGPVLEAPVTPTSTVSSGLDWEYAMRWSNGIKDVMATFIPRAAGGSGSEVLSANSEVAKDLTSKGVNPDFGFPLYYGSLPFTAGPSYLGASVLFLFVFGLFYMKRSLRYWFIAAVLLTLLMSMGKNFSLLNKMMFDLLPLLNKFRAPSSILSITAVIVPIGAALGLGAFMKGHQKSFVRPIWIALGVVGGLCLLTAILGPMFMDFSGPNDEGLASQGWSVEALKADRKSALTADAWRSLIWVLLCSAVVWVYHQGKIKQWLLLSGLGLFIIADLWPVDRRYVSSDDFIAKRTADTFFEPREVDKLILSDADLFYRVHDLTRDPFNSAMASYLHHTVGGYSPAKFQRYQDLIDRYISKGNQNVFNMLNTKYFIINDDQKNPVVRTNQEVFGNAWFVDNINIVNTNTEELNALDTVDLTTNVFIHKEFADEVSGFDPVKGGQIKLVDYAPDHLKYSVSGPSEQLAVFSDIWYGPNKGWQAYIDGKEAPHFRADYVLRGMRIPAGDHTVEFKFNPSSYRTGEMISLFFSLIIVAALLFGIYKWLTTPPPMLPVPVAETIRVKKAISPKKKNR